MSDAQALFEAIRAGNVADVEQLLQKNTALASARNKAGISALTWSMYVSQPAIRDLLLSRLTELDLHEAVIAARGERVAQLLDEDPDSINRYSSDGFTALGLAAFFGQYELAQLLLERGADPNLASNNSQRVAPLHSAVAQRIAEQALRMASLLIRHRANVNATQHSGWTPLHQASAHGNDELVKVLLEQGADPAAAADDGMTASDFARKSNHHSTVQLLAVQQQ